MRIKADESYEQWVERVSAFELAHARKELANGVPVDEVLDWMSKRINQKLLHPVITSIKNKPIDFDIEASKKAYEEAYLRKNSPKPDHLTED
jgi:glutamyl-tRNA reductase